jgi:chemotaxis protein methyltransferase CheR
MDESFKNGKIELELLLEAIYRKYGYDFRDYSKASIKRRIMNRISIAGLESISQAQHELLYNQKFFETLLLDLTVNVTEMFRDPTFFKEVRENIIPELKKQPAINIWHAGCASGEEVYSMAIILWEEGLWEKSRIYATDTNEAILAAAKKGVYPIDKMKGYTTNYLKAGGRASFSDYYSAHYEHAMIEKFLKKNIVFSDHNLATDTVFGEMDLIMCRNVLIYFNSKLQNRIFQLFADSLSEEGFLCLGSKETIVYSDSVHQFETVSDEERIFRKRSDNKKS